MAFAWEMDLMQCPACGKDNAAGARFCERCGAALDAASDDPLLGRVLADRYVIRRKIAEGGMGVVYEAEQRMGSVLRRVAIKTLLPSVSRDRKLVARFYRECGMLSQLEHPNTIRLYDFGQASDGTLYVAMEYADGRSLGEVINDGAMPLDRVLPIVRQVCAALHEAHEKGIVHRDLKPDNIVVTQRAGEEVVKLLDFGIATRIGGTGTEETKLTQHGTVLGTPPYMSPEQLAGERVDRRSDIYSLGIIVYEMLTGRLPFEADTPIAWASQHMTAPPRPMVGIARSVERAVLHALGKLPAERPANTPIFYHELERAAESQTQPDDADTKTVDHPLTSLMPALPASIDQKGNTVLSAYPPASVAPPSALSLQPPALHRRSGRRRGFTYALGLVLAAGGVAAAIGLSSERDFSGTQAQPTAVATPAAPPATQLTALIEPEPIVPASQPPNSEPPKPPSVVKRAPKPAPPAATPLPPPITLPPAPTATTPPAPLPPVAVPPPPATTPPAPAPVPPRLPIPPPRAPAPPAPAPPPANAGLRGDAACSQAQSRASSADIEGAVAMYRLCQSTGGSPNALNNARGRITAQAPAAVRRRAFNGDCAGARNAVAAASSIGAGGPAQGELSKTSCG